MKPKKIFLNLLNYCIASFILLNANTVYIHSNPKVYQICQMIFPIICLFLFLFVSMISKLITCFSLALEFHCTY
jgi:hypothetical protein